MWQGASSREWPIPQAEAALTPVLIELYQSKVTLTPLSQGGFVVAAAVFQTVAVVFLMVAWGCCWHA